MDTSIEEVGKKIKRDVEGWREIIIYVESLLTWQRPADPGIIVGALSIVFLVFWYLDPSFITTGAMICMFAAIADYVAPKISGKFFPADYWNSKREKKLDEICRSLAVCALSLKQHSMCFFNMRTSQPTVFFAITLTLLAGLTWIGNSINNVLLTYLTVTLVLLLPGLNSKGLLKPVKNILSATCCKSDATKKID